MLLICQWEWEWLIGGETGKRQSGRKGYVIYCKLFTWYLDLALYPPIPGFCLFVFWHPLFLCLLGFNWMCSLLSFNWTGTALWASGWLLTEGFSALERYLLLLLSLLSFRQLYANFRGLILLCHNGYYMIESNPVGSTEQGSHTGKYEVKIQNTQEIKRTFFNWIKQDKTCKFSSKSSFSSYVQHKNRKTNN